MISSEELREGLREACVDQDVPTRQLASLAVVIELLLDIRDLLQPPKITIQRDEEGFKVGSLGRDEGGG